MMYRLAIGYPLGLTLSDEDNSPKYCLEFAHERILLSVKEFSVWVMALAGDSLPQKDNEILYQKLLHSKYIIEIDSTKDICAVFNHHYAIRQGSGSISLDQTPCVSLSNISIELTPTQMLVWQSMCSSIELSKIMRWLLTNMSAEDIIGALVSLVQKELLYII